jgi:hypothetical protein
MLTRQEYNELYRLLEQLGDAWRAYVNNIVTHHGQPDPAFGMQVSNAEDRLKKYLREQL